MRRPYPRWVLNLAGVLMVVAYVRGVLEDWGYSCYRRLLGVLGIRWP